MAEVSLKQKTAKGLFWGGLSNGVQQLMGAVFGIFMLRLLNVDDYGIVGMLSIFTGIAMTIISTGFSVALTNKRDATHDDYNAVFWFYFFFGLLLYAILFFCAPLIAKFYGYPELTALSRVVFLGFFINGLGISSYTVLFKKMMTRQQAIMEMSSLFIASVAGILLAISGFSYWALALQTLLHISLITGLRLVFAPWKPTLQINFAPLKQMFSFSIKLIFTNVLQQISGNIFSMILGKFYTKAQVGYYSNGQKWMGMGTQCINGMMTYVTQPVLVHLQDDKKRQAHALRKLIRFGAFVSFPLMLGLAFIGPEFILVVTGEKWLPSVPFLQLFCVWGSIVFLNTYYTHLIYTHGKSNIYMNGSIVIIVLQLLAVACLYSHGILPMFRGYLAVNFVGLGIWHFYVHRLIGLRLRDVLKDILPYLLITLACFFVTWLITRNLANPTIVLMAKIVISGILYLGVMKMSKSVIFKESLNYLLKNRIRD
ncbi:MAG: lipopolysaccharide biosynthesis protein [Candidatus Symbiothrix sp.]|jgi:O-antigen/teichoic acid export membrane protein|nr:lipopolysaccharide biosynthesis protein [Candidatus Symbiothrix sp.]